MGATFVRTQMPGELGPAEVERRFEELRRTDLYENGHSYSGGWGMFPGLKFARLQVFDDQASAEEWVAEYTKKSQPAAAVRFRDKDGVEQWLLGGWASC
jgi:hypothetical protein